MGCVEEAPQRRITEARKELRPHPRNIAVVSNCHSCMPSQELSSRSLLLLSLASPSSYRSLLRLSRTVSFDYLSKAVRTHAVSELRVAMFANVVFKVDPRLRIRFDFLTVRTNQQNAAKRFDFFQRCVQFLICADKTAYRSATLAVQQGDHDRQRDED